MKLLRMNPNHYISLATDHLKICWSESVYVSEILSHVRVNPTLRSPQWGPWSLTFNDLSFQQLL